MHYYIIFFNGICQRKRGRATHPVSPGTIKEHDNAPTCHPELDSVSTVLLAIRPKQTVDSIPSMEWQVLSRPLLQYQTATYLFLTHRTNLL
jgi:hypothetical protein